ncbi:MerR family transcriptional regulator [Allokutzneria sp. A3M-2-11 16]|uniref:MerR family transcriptional regulator n=1 Tax=Allokutzneria sp. A3M-2-11 16 TaxID=2962043 RepID=UPI0020B8879C|nr:MerR family transcriptional regulator [Allokutzneria sp. A3M-2-11 16]MCP3803176.1 MerR family transcriptional regulator [Allokutzneria sp. A3M-2-11 16]
MHSISTVAKAFGVPVSTLRYYDDLGLLAPAERRGNVRYYGRAELERLALIQRLHHQGLVSLADTAELLGDGSRGREVLTTAAGAIADRIAELTSAHRLLEHLLTCPNADPVRDCTTMRAELDEIIDAALADQETS